MVDEILDIKAHHGQPHPRIDLLQPLHIIFLHLIILTQAHPRHHAGVSREVHDPSPHHFWRGMHVLNHQAPPTRAGGQLLFDGLTFAKFFDFAALELDAGGAGFEGLYDARMPLGLVSGGREEEGGEEEEGEESEEEREKAERALCCGHVGGGGVGELMCCCAGGGDEGIEDLVGKGTGPVLCV